MIKNQYIIYAIYIISILIIIYYIYRIYNPGKEQSLTYEINKISKRVNNTLNEDEKIFKNSVDTTTNKLNDTLKDMLSFKTQ